MTREKAIRLLTTKRAQPSTDYQMAEVYTMAIQALSQEPCRVKNELNVELNELKPCTDAVSRQYLLDLANKDEAYDYVSAKEIADAPSVNPQPCDDAISRDAVCDALLDYWHDIQFVDGSGYDVYKDCKAVIDELSSVTQKSGKWIDREEYDADRWMCSVCGRTERYKENYCPNCGAKMESGDKE